MRIFSVEEAQGQTAWLTARWQELCSLRDQLAAARERLRVLRERAFCADDEGSVELDFLAALDEVAAARAACKEAEEAIEASGVLLRQGSVGTFDFPTLHRGQPGYLCWVAGEADVAHWHGPSEGYAQRRPL